MKKLFLVLALALVLSGQQSGVQRAVISFSAATGDNQIIGIVPLTTTIKIWKVVLSLAATTNVTYIQGTGTNCATGKTAITGAMTTVQSIVDIMPPGMPIELGPGNAFCITVSSSSTGGGYVLFTN